jgi:hypothetical protein
MVSDEQKPEAAVPPEDATIEDEEIDGVAGGYRDPWGNTD